MDNTNENVPSNDHYLDPHMNNTEKVTVLTVLMLLFAFIAFIIQTVHGVYSLQDIKSLLRTDATEKTMNKDPDLLKRASALLN